MADDQLTFPFHDPQSERRAKHAARERARRQAMTPEQDAERRRRMKEYRDRTREERLAKRREQRRILKTTLSPEEWATIRQKEDEANRRNRERLGIEEVRRQKRESQNRRRTADPEQHREIERRRRLRDHILGQQPFRLRVPKPDPTEERLNEAWLLLAKAILKEERKVQKRHRAAAYARNRAAQKREAKKAAQALWEQANADLLEAQRLRKAEDAIIRKYLKAARASDREKEKRRRDPARARAKDRQQATLHRDARNARVRRWYQENRGKAIAGAVARERRRREQGDVIFKLKKTLRGRVRSALQHLVRYRGCQPKTPRSIVRLLGCPIERFKEHIERQFADGMTWENWGPFGWHLDHIKPLAGFDLLDPSQLAIACHWSNFQPLWWDDNIRKGNRNGAI